MSKPSKSSWSATLKDNWLPVVGSVAVVAAGIAYFVWGRSPAKAGTKPPAGKAASIDAAAAPASQALGSPSAQAADQKKKKNSTKKKAADIDEKKLRVCD